jgi:hypothetical protein
MSASAGHIHSGGQGVVGIIKARSRRRRSDEFDLAALGIEASDPKEDSAHSNQHCTHCPTPCRRFTRQKAASAAYGATSVCTALE